MTVKHADVTQKMQKKLAARHRAETRFQWYGRSAIGCAFVVLAFLLVSIAVPGISGLQRTEVLLEIALNDSHVSVTDVKKAARRLYKDALYKQFPDVVTPVDRRALTKLVSYGSKRSVMDAWPSYDKMNIRTKKLWVPAADEVDLYIKGHIDVNAPDADQPLNVQQRDWLQKMVDAGNVRKVFNSGFFERGDSRQPEQSGFLGAIMGSLLTMIVCLAVAFPIGVLSATYLEEFSSRGWMRDIIEVNINNLAAVPSIVFGLLGLAVYLNFFGMPRSAPVVGGLTLALMTLPTIIITTRVALQSVPHAIRQAAMGLGASPLQVVMHHVLPLAMPGIMTGTILGMARAIGETAPLLMIGMVAFIVNVPEGVLDAATVMPVQIYIWASSPEMGFVEKTAAAILVLIAILLVMNAAAIFLRKKYERKW